MLRFILFLSIVMVAFASPRRLSGKRSSGVSQLYYGTPIGGTFIKNGTLEFVKNSKLYPFVVEFEYFSNHLCGGALIRADVVITAPHCFNFTDIDYVVVLAGHLFRNDPFSQSRLVKSVEMYNETDFVQFADDIALVQLDHPFTLGRFINIIALPTSQYIKDMYVNEVATLFGWGLTENDDISDVLRKIDLQVIREKKCANLINEDSAKNVICGLGANDKRVVSCGGDSGGPLVILGANPPTTSVLIGVNSYGFDEKDTNNTRCDSKQPSVAINIAYYLDWVTNQLNEFK